MSEEAAVSELDRLEAATGECREMIREAHAATKDLRAAVRDAKRELQDLAKDEVAAQVQREVSRQLEELGEQTSAAITAATQKVIAEFDRFGEALLGKETYWQTASGRRSATRPDTDVVTLDVQPGELGVMLEQEPVRRRRRRLSGRRWLSTARSHRTIR